MVGSLFSIINLIENVFCLLNFKYRNLNLFVFYLQTLPKPYEIQP